jgi:hypothetical protein
MVIDKPIEERPLVIGPRLQAELRRRANELLHRHKDKITPEEARELAALLELLRLGGADGQR